MTRFTNRSTLEIVTRSSLGGQKSHFEMDGAVTSICPSDDVAGGPLGAAIAGTVQPTCSGESASCSTPRVSEYRNGCVELRNVSIAGSSCAALQSAAHTCSSPN